MQKKPKVIVIVGPTAVGKTALSIKLAHHFQTEIISADSLQVYRSLDIGTAKASLEEQAGIRHHLLDVREWDQSYTVADFQAMAETVMDELHKKGQVPIIVGGTGLYIQALLARYQLGGNEETAAEVQAIRAKWTKYYEVHGGAALHTALQQLDEPAAAVIHPNNVKRVIRALEVFERTGESIQAPKNQQANDWQYDVQFIGLTTEREQLYARINWRVEEMINQGLETEARLVFQQPGVQAAQGIGYKEFFPYFRGEQDLATTVATIQQHSRQYAKRQYTWFRNRMDIRWWDLVNRPEEYRKIVTELESWVNE